MKLFGSKRPGTNPTGAEVPLGELDEGVVLLFGASVYSFRAGLSGELAGFFDPALTAVRAELQRRWLQRGAAVTIRFPERLPALQLDAMAQGFAAIAKSLSISGEYPQEVQDLATVRILRGAEALAERVAAAVLEIRVAAPAELR